MIPDALSILARGVCGVKRNHSAFLHFLTSAPAVNLPTNIHRKLFEVGLHLGADKDDFVLKELNPLVFLNV